MLTKDCKIRPQGAQSSCNALLNRLWQVITTLGVPGGSCSSAHEKIFRRALTAALTKASQTSSGSTFLSDIKWQLCSLTAAQWTETAAGKAVGPTPLIAPWHSPPSLQRRSPAAARHQRCGSSEGCLPGCLCDCSCPSGPRGCLSWPGDFPQPGSQRPGGCGGSTCRAAVTTADKACLVLKSRATQKG